MKIHWQLTVFFLLSVCISSFGQNEFTTDSSKLKKWFPKYDFNITSFQKPSYQFRPFARWWWPGNDVTNEELKREINLFADNNFGGVEIQPLAQVFVPGSKEDRAKTITWDTPDYYEHLKTVMEEARKRSITVDMTDGSGWPPGGYYLSDSDAFLSLESASVNVTGNSFVSIALPTIANTTKSPSRLEAVMAAKNLPKTADDKTQTLQLDPSSVITVTKYVTNDSLHWKAPEGDWRIIAFWSKPASQKTLSASAVQGPVVNHFDSLKIIKNYKHLFGDSTGLQPYYGNPIRAVFDDSYEFAVNRHYSLDFISYFKKQRGYDVTPWLPAEMQKGYNYVSYMRPNATPDFSFSEQDWRLRYDYDLTLSELLGEQFLKAGKDWLEPKGLLHRTQAYGLNLDMMAEAGLASIPETESMLGPEANLKIMTSGGHLYNRPIISAESVVFSNRAYTTTPQKIKIAIDKLFAAGVNQVIYHGVPYRYTPAEVGSEGWYPFSSPVLGLLNFSSNLGEGNIFWKYQKDVNEYISRTQYALRAGKPHADVLIYFPFMDVDGMPDNPEEILTKGYMEAVEGPLPASKELKNADKEKWAQIVYPLINQLEANGITWDWVNDLSIQGAFININKQINIRGNIYQALILADDSVIQIKTAQQINNLAKRGMNFIATGVLPDKQPSYLNWQLNDKKTAMLIAKALKAKNSAYLSNTSQLIKWMKSIRQSVAFNGKYHFARQVQRNMSDGSRIQFIWNKSDAWQTLSLTLDKIYFSSFWLNAEDGSIIKNNSSVISYQLPPYGSIILYASTKKNTVDSASLATSFIMSDTKQILALNNWNIKTDSVQLNNSPLFNWRTNEQLKFSSAEGIYTSSFEWNNDNTSSHFYLDLGQVYFTAEVYINGKLAGKRIFAPYLLDITSLLQKGINNIEVRVTTGQLNGFIEKAKQGDKRYKQFKGKEDQLMSAGLVGPVTIRQDINNQNP